MLILVWSKYLRKIIKNCGILFEVEFLNILWILIWWLDKWSGEEFI